MQLGKIKIFELAVELVTSTCSLAMSALSNWVKCSSLCGPISHSLKIDHPNGESALKVLCWVDTTSQSQDWRFSLRVYVQYLLWEVHQLQFALINVPRFVIGFFFSLYWWICSAPFRSPTSWLLSHCGSWLNTVDHTQTKQFIVLVPLFKSQLKLPTFKSKNTNTTW